MNENTSAETVEKIESFDIYKNKIKELEGSYRELEDSNGKLKETVSTLREEIVGLKKQLASK